MCRPIRGLTEARGYDPVRIWCTRVYLFTSHSTQSNHVLACFGGAGAQHACAIARKLGMQTVFIHRFAGILSAYGLGLADIVEEEQVSGLRYCTVFPDVLISQEACAKAYNSKDLEYLHERIDVLKQRGVAKLKELGFTDTQIVSEVSDSVENIG